MLFAVWTQYAFGILLSVTSVFLILLVLIQRGRGGGLTGALGGMGGQSAFGTKAGDLFTRVTVVVAAIWIGLCVLAIVTLNTGAGGLLGPPTTPPAPTTQDGAADGMGAGDAAATTPTPQSPAVDRPVTQPGPPAGGAQTTPAP
jgi:preprotein translocase subunit SecG